MVNVCSGKCRTEGCDKRPPFGVAGTRTVEYCAKHATDGMVNASMICAHRGCNKHASLGVAGLTKTEYCAQHNRPKFGVEGCRSREDGPHNSEKETIGNASLSGVKRRSVNPLSAQASPPSGGNGSSCKRVRQVYITSVASKEVVARESAAGAAATLPKTDEQKFPIKQNSSVKMELHLSF
ncbi:unnamed protein product [Ascophyllum nodosum]